MNKGLIILFLSLIMISSVYALGVTPARTTLDYKDGMQESVNFKVLNSDNKDMKVSLSARGELAEYITLSSSEAIFSADEDYKDFSYSFDLPDDLSPGLHVGEIFVLEVPSDVDDNGATVSATLAVVIQLYIYVPYPGKYAVARMLVSDVNKGEDVPFIFPVTSLGEFDLTSVRVNVDIYDSLGVKVDSFNTDTVSILSGERKEIVYNWDNDVDVGAYRAIATVIYDEGTISLNESFSIGNRDLELQEINVNNFVLGDIVKLEMLVENKWNEPISDAYVRTKIMNNDGAVVSKFDSTTYDISALAKQVFVSYWDTAGVKEGTYETEISINYGEKSSKKNLIFEVSADDLTIVGLGYVISSSGGSNNLVVILLIVIVILVLINLLWFFILRKKMKK